MDELETYVRSEMEAAEVPGLALVIVQGGQVAWAAPFGQADPESGSPMTLETPMRVGSISKTFVALTTMRLVEKGYFDLDARLEEWLPSLQLERYEEGNPVLVRHLLEHTSGIDDDLIPDLSAVYAPDQVCETEMTEVLDVALPALQSVPGEVYSYSNLGYSLLGAIMEQAVGEQFDDVVQAEIVDPLGMVNSGFRLTSSIAESIATGHTKTGEGLVAVEYRCHYLRAGGLFHASANDMARMLMMLIGDGVLDGEQILLSDSLDEMWAMRTWQDGKEYGLGLTVDTILDDRRIVGHAGGVEGFNSHAWFDPQSGVGVVSLVNCSHIACIQANERVRDAAFQVLLTSSD
jgi:CubicO group peptidase (beta-lactamase class C family)